MTTDLLLPSERAALDILTREAVELIVANRHRDKEGTDAEKHANHAEDHAHNAYWGVNCNRPSDGWLDPDSGKLSLSHALARMVLALAKVGT